MRTWKVLREVVQGVGVLLVLVPPAVALLVAKQVREELLAAHRDSRLVYVDLNSVSPDTVHKLAEVFAGTAVDFVDSAISGPASRLATGCTLYLSGTRAEEVAELFNDKMMVQVLGEVPGQASALRMLLSGLTKGVIALFVEMALAAQRAGILNRTLAAYRTVILVSWRSWSVRCRPTRSTPCPRAGDGRSRDDGVASWPVPDHRAGHSAGHGSGGKRRVASTTGQGLDRGRDHRRIACPRRPHGPQWVFEPWVMWLACTPERSFPMAEKPKSAELHPGPGFRIRTNFPRLPSLIMEQTE